MKGSYEIIVSNAKIQYNFTIRRNITIIKGDSATGKTTLVDMIREYDESGENSGIVLICKRKCRVLEGRDWRVLLDTMEKTIIFIDEGNSFLSTNEFAQAVRKSDNYYVLVSREGLPNLPYSVEEIYGIRESGKYASLKKTYNELYHIYNRVNYKEPVKPECVLVEDSNAGYEFFKGVSKKKTYSVISAGGKSNIFRELMKKQDGYVLVIADGAAFGPEMDRVMKLAGKRKEIVLYLPESFEWLILKSGIVGSKKLKDVLEEPEEFIESSEYLSWERFFTRLLMKMTNDTYFKYSKQKLNEVYLHENISSKILSKMNEIEL